MTVRIVTDSACDLSNEQAAELGIEIVPLSIRFGDQEFTDRVDLSVEGFYERLASSDTLPETAAPSPGSFEAAFGRAVDAGATEIVCVNLSGDLSGTIQSAQAAAKEFTKAAVTVVDSHSITSGLGSQVMAAAEMAQAGKPADEIVAHVEDLATRTRVYGTLDTLENLKKGGRIGGAQAMLGSLLSIKPCIDVSSGKVEDAGKSRTRKKALQWLANKVLDEPVVERLCVAHGHAPDIDDFLALLEPRFPRDTVAVAYIGAVIGTHGGPRVMGVTFQTAS